MQQIDGIRNFADVCYRQPDNTWGLLQRNKKREYAKYSDAIDRKIKGILPEIGSPEIIDINQNQA